MTDREKVINGLTDIHDEAYDRYVHCQYIKDKLLTLIDKTIPDAIALLREQEPQAVNDPGAICPNCKWPLYPEDHPHYCGNCGRKVKWE